VIIGIGDYDNDAIADRPQAIDNAAHVVRFLRTDVGIEGDRILTGRNATLSDFADIFGKPGEAKGELRDVLKNTKTPEVIVYYAGRAKALDGGSDVLLLPADADPGKPETGVRLSALYDQLAAMGISKLRVYLDPAFVPGEEVVEVAAGPRIGLFGLFTPGDWVTLSAASDDAQCRTTRTGRAAASPSRWWPACAASPTRRARAMVTARSAPRSSMSSPGIRPRPRPSVAKRCPCRPSTARPARRSGPTDRGVSLALPVHSEGKRPDQLPKPGTSC